MHNGECVVRNEGTNPNYELRIKNYALKNGENGKVVGLTVQPLSPEPPITN